MYLEDSVALGIEMESKFRELNKTLPVEAQMSGFNENVSASEQTHTLLPAPADPRCSRAEA